MTSLIDSREQILANCRRLQMSLKHPKAATFRHGVSLVKKGVCFIVVAIDDELTFSPSRFVGYRNNSIKAHNDNSKKNGNDTNRAINKALCRRPAKSADLEAAYVRYCDRIGLAPKKTDRRRFWDLRSEYYFDGGTLFSVAVDGIKTDRERFENEVQQLEDQPLEVLFDRFQSMGQNDGVGRFIVVEKKAFVRSAVVAAIARKRASFSCEINGCGHHLFRLSSGKNYCEVHHIEPLAAGGADVPSNVACLCPSHHREIHHGRASAVLTQTLRTLRRKHHDSGL